jgi:hypothetical protein
VNRIPEYGIYCGVESHWVYHDDCLEEVLCNPESYGHKVVDYMLGVVERVKQHKQTMIDEKESARLYREQQILRAKEVCIEEIRT